MLGDNSLGVAVQASGQIRDIGGQLLYLNTSRRWNWGASIQRVPYVYGYGAYTNTGVEYTLAHIAVTGASVFTQYPLSQTRRFELGTGYTHYGYALESIQESFTGRTNRTRLDSPPSLGLTEATAAFVGDDSFFGFTSPISGTRYRLEVTPTIGSLNYQTALVDVRRYFFAKPLTLAFRGMHYGRYGRDADSDRIGAIFLGDGSLVRGYSYESFGNGDCTSTGTGSLAGSSCPQFDRLLGSRLALANLELRIPLLGTQGFGILDTPLPPMELAPFVDAGVAWTGSSGPAWQLGSNSGDRTPVVSAGIASRWNLFGFAVLQLYYAHPFQRPGTSGTWGILLQPGW
jgi:outer membrane protein assembly factor BamA